MKHCERNHEAERAADRAAHPRRLVTEPREDGAEVEWNHTPHGHGRRAERSALAVGLSRWINGVAA